MTSSVRGRLRSSIARMAIIGTVLAGSSVALLGVGAAHAAVDPPLNLTVTDVAGPAINVDWDTPTTGDAVTYYRVRIDNTATPLNPDYETFTAATQTALNGFAANYATTYSVCVASNNEPTLGQRCVTHTTPPGPVVECATAVWTPFCTVDAFIRQQYNDWLDRGPTFSELAFWRANLQPRNSTNAGSQAAFLDLLRQSKDVKAGPVVRLYVAYFLRNPEFGGYQFWLNAITSGGWTMGQISDFFASSPEFQQRYGSLDNASFVTLVYQNVLGRTPDAAGFDFWTRQLNSGQSRGWMMLQFTEAPSLEFQNKTVIAVVTTEVFAEMLNRVPTLAEYDRYTFLLFGMNYPAQAVDVAPLYRDVLVLNEYRGRIVIR